MNNTRQRGFSLMDPEYQREIASLGGRAAHKNGSAHQWNSETAREAGRKGAAVRAQKRLERQQQIALIQQQHHQK